MKKKERTSLVAATLYAGYKYSKDTKNRQGCQSSEDLPIIQQILIPNINSQYPTIQNWKKDNSELWKQLNQIYQMPDKAEAFFTWGNCHLENMGYLENVNLHKKIASDERHHDAVSVNRSFDFYGNAMTKMIWQESVVVDDENITSSDNLTGISINQTINIITRDGHNLIMTGGTQNKYAKDDINLYANGYLLGDVISNTDISSKVNKILILFYTDDEGVGLRSVYYLVKK
ncbi:hypothetical protein CPAV1605_769 [seawater metagenome]|uniref:Uncharacterized protein n=1 Tax=seawater metagenome TaxID=1561972 RepID=A0A5E8CK51_9ZZZZ